MANTQEVRIQVIFRTDTSKGTYQDALWFTQEEYDKVTPEEIEVMKQERIDNWLSVVSTPPSEPAKEERLDRIQSEIDDCTLRIQELQAEKDKINV